MKRNQKRKLPLNLPSFASLIILAAISIILSGCKSPDNQPQAPAQAPPIAPLVAPPTASAPSPSDQSSVNSPTAGASTPSLAPAETPKSSSIIRIKTGVTTPLTDSDGIVWQPDQGFADGDTIARPDVKIEGTKNPALYQSEHYGMTSFTYPVANGKYLIKLHFAETYEGITGPGQRVFSVNVQGHEIKDLDIWSKAGGALRPWIESVPVEVTDGKVHITFTAGVENPEINGIEIIPQS